MSQYSKLAFRYFGRYSENISLFFPDLKGDLKKTEMKTSVQEYISSSILTTLLVFLLEIPLLSFAYALVFKSFLFAFISGFTTSVLLSILIFFLFTKYPKTIVSERAKKLDATLPFSSLYLSTISGTKLSLHKIFQIFGKFSSSGEIGREITMLNKDMDAFGFDAHVALERAIERSPSKDFRDLLWGILSTSVSGGDITSFLKEKAKSLMEDYRRKLVEFSKKMMLISEVYLTAIILGTIFFVILTAIFSGISNGVGNIILLQSIVIFVFLPLMSVMFIIFIKMSEPGEE
jgi:archaeal flagellar protein FlaJ